MFYEALLLFGVAFLATWVFQFAAGTLQIEGWRRHRWLGKSLTGGFFLAMCFAAIYLDHHWVLDVVVGIAYTLAGYAAVSWFFARRKRAAQAVSEAP